MTTTHQPQDQLNRMTSDVSILGNDEERIRTFDRDPSEIDDIINEEAGL